MARPEDTFPGEEAREPGPSSDARTWAVICHLAAFAVLTSIPFANILGPLVVWLIKRHDDPFIDENGKAALNFQISLTAYVVGAALLLLPAFFAGFFLPGPWLILAMPFAMLVFLAALVFGGIVVVIAAMRANEGIVYRYPLTIRFVQ